MEVHDRRSHCWSAVGPFYPLYPLVGFFLPLHPTCYMYCMYRRSFPCIHSSSSSSKHYHSLDNHHLCSDCAMSKENLSKVVLGLPNDGPMIPHQKLSSDFQTKFLQSIWPQSQYCSDVQKLLKKSSDSCKYLPPPSLFFF